MNFIKWNNWLGKHMFLIVISALLIGLNIPIPKSPLLTSTAIGLFAYMTFVTALENSFKEFTKVMHSVINKPWQTIWILLLIHVVTPIIAWIVGLIFYPDNQFIRLGFLISASIPVAVTSIIWTSLTKGNVLLSIIIVTLDTIFVPLVLPAYFKIVVGEILTVNYFALILHLLFMVTIPSTAGMILNDFTHGTFNKFSKSIGGLTSKIAIFLIVFLNSAMLAAEIKWNAELIKLLLVVLLLVACGYCLGLLGSFVIKEKRHDIISAMIYNVGMRNISFGSLLAITYFPSSVVIPIILATLYQQPLAALVAKLLNRYLSE